MQYTFSVSYEGSKWYLDGNSEVPTKNTGTTQIMTVPTFELVYGMLASEYVKHVMNCNLP